MRNDDKSAKYLAAAKKPRDIIISHPLMLRLQLICTFVLYIVKQSRINGKQKWIYMM